MCGIVYSKSFIGKPVNKTILKRYIFQRNRGTNGFGFYTPETNTLTHNEKEGRILSLLRRNKKATEILFHHRMPTSTMNVRNACHPFSTKDYFKHNYVVVHNGVLYNEDELRVEHEKRGIDYISEQEDGSFNDSEALAYDIARYIEGEVSNITAEGTIAFIAIQRDKRGKPKALYFGRNNGNPLKMKQTLQSLTLSSEGEGENIDPNTLYRYDYKTGVTTREVCLIPGGFKQSNYGYMGEGTGGYWHGGHYYEDEEEYRQNQAWEHSFSPSSSDTESYFIDETIAGRREAMEQVSRLMRENYSDRSNAIAQGYSEIADCKKVEDGLRHNVEILGIASEDETDKFYSVGDKRYYLELAVKALEGGVSGQSQMGFRNTDLDEADRDYPSPHSWEVRDRTRERIDPTTGYAYYPYAD